jgi:hypothetical protein
MRAFAMKLHTREQAPREGEAEAPKGQPAVRSAALSIPPNKITNPKPTWTSTPQRAPRRQTRRRRRRDAGAALGDAPRPPGRLGRRRRPSLNPKS